MCDLYANTLMNTRLLKYCVCDTHHVIGLYMGSRGSALLLPTVHHILYYSSAPPNIEVHGKPCKTFIVTLYQDCINNLIITMARETRTKWFGQLKIFILKRMS